MDRDPSIKANEAASDETTSTAKARPESAVAKAPVKGPKPNELYHDKRDRVFVRGIQGHYNLTEELKRLRCGAPRAQGQGAASSSTGRRPIPATTSSPRTASRSCSTSISRNTRRVASRRSTVTSTRRPSTSSTARATRSMTACATTGRPATSPSCTTTACTSTSMRPIPSRRGRSCSRPSRCTCS